METEGSDKSQSIFISSDKADSSAIKKFNHNEYRQRTVEDTIRLVKVFAIQLLYLIIMFYISCTIILEPRTTRWFFWKNLLNKTGLLFVLASLITKLCMRYGLLEKQVTRMFALLLDVALLKYIIIFIYYSFAMDPKI